MPESNVAHRAELSRIARLVLQERGLLADFAPAVREELDRITRPAFPSGDGWKDLTDLPWCSIDNDDSRDLDQLTAAEATGETETRVFVAVADVDALVRKGSAIDDHARYVTTSVYTSAGVFPMLPEKLCTDLTSLNEGEDRLAIVVEATVTGDGSLREEDVYPAVVRNKAKLAYPGVGDWLEHREALPERAAAVPGMAEQLRVQDAAAQRLKRARYEQGALEFDTHEPITAFENDHVVDLVLRPRNRATELIENFMVAANGVVARFLGEQGSSAVVRVVRSPERWPVIVEYAKELGDQLPAEPEARALRAFLARRRRADPLRFPDVSLAVIKLLGRGEYVARPAGAEGEGHFGLAVRDYAHSTAPNRRFPDLITHRLLKAALDGADAPYDDADLSELAEHCTQQESAAEKVERRLRKSAAALLLSDRVGERFEAIVTGASRKGTWVRITALPVEGKLVRGEEGLRVGKKLEVRLVDTDAELGFIDFVRA